MIQYDPHNWFDHLFALKGSLLPKIIGRITSCTIWSMLIVILHGFVGQLGVPVVLHSVLGTALGLLLVFRTNSSYDRFWEGRRLWGSIVNETRNLARASRVFLREAPAIHAEVVRWTIAFPYSCMNSLRGKVGLGPAVEHLPDEEVDAVVAANHVPLAIAGRISACLARANAEGVLPDYKQVELDRNVQLFIDYIGACERIRKTPIPFAYMVHIRRSLILYCYTLPFALIGEFGWATIPATMLVSYVFLGIEELGVEIEDPFGVDDNDLPLEQICETIRGNLLPLVDIEAAPAPALVPAGIKAQSA